MAIKSYLRDLSMLPAPSGYENTVGRYILDHLQGLGCEAHVDTVGNVISHFPSSDPKGKKIMIFAHMDSLGLVVKYISSDGFIHLERLGGVPEKVLPALEVLVRTEDGRWIDGIIGNKSHHITDASEKYKVIPYGELYVDIGASSDAEVRALGIEVGCPIVYRPRWNELQNGRCYGTALDNRGGCAVLLDLAEKFSSSASEHDIHIVWSVQEEYNLRGAMQAAAAIRPDMAIALDVVITGDTPDTEGKLEPRLGEGPVLGMYNFHGRGTLNGLIPHPLLVDLAKKAAADNGIPLQRFVSTGLLTDAAYVQLVGTGVPSVDLGFPCRYTHTAVETCSVVDLEKLSLLVEKLIRSVSCSEDFCRRY